jgi:hypothetical protein
MSMISLLNEALLDLPDLLSKDDWESKLVDYETPHVERLYRPWREQYRLSLHRIFPCEQPLFHPHPWPSAVTIVSGQYEMAIGYGTGPTPPPVAATVVLSTGASYEMKEPDGWHSVNPICEPSLSVMVTDKPFEFYNPATQLGKGKAPKNLDPKAKEFLLNAFRWYFG